MRVLSVERGSATGHLLETRTPMAPPGVLFGVRSVGDRDSEKFVVGVDMWQQVGGQAGLSSLTDRTLAKGTMERC